MRIIFAGTPEFAAAALSRLLDAGHTVPLVLTQPDRPAGRGMRVIESPVKKIAMAAGIEVFQPQSLKRDPAAPARLRAVAHDVMVVAAYGLILPQAVLDSAPRGCLNIHASLLPRWRGAAPIQRAIEAGDRQIGICIMRMDAGLDTGPVLARRVLPIDAADTARGLTDALARLGADLLVDTLRELDSLSAQAQPAEGVTYAAKIEKAEAPLDFRVPAAILARKVRAFDPFPGASASIGGQVIKVWSAEPGLHSRMPQGEVLAAGSDGVAVTAGDGTSLLLTELQRAGGKRLSVREFLKGFPLVLGNRFEVQT